MHGDLLRFLLSFFIHVLAAPGAFPALVTRRPVRDQPVHALGQPVGLFLGEHFRDVQIPVLIEKNRPVLASAQLRIPFLSADPTRLRESCFVGQDADGHGWNTEHNILSDCEIFSPVIIFFNIHAGSTKPLSRRRVIYGQKKHELAGFGGAFLRLVIAPFVIALYSNIDYEWSDYE